eukprot:4134923-Prymnesium_polylepis.1
MDHGTWSWRHVRRVTHTRPARHAHTGTKVFAQPRSTLAPDHKMRERVSKHRHTENTCLVGRSVRRRVARRSG